MKHLQQVSITEDETGIHLHLGPELNFAQLVLNQLTATHVTEVTKPWGYEKIWQGEDIVVKFIHVGLNHKTSLQKHVQKDEIILPIFPNGEAGYIEAGGMKLKSPARLKAGTVHRAVGPITFIEISSNHLDDVVRIEDEYGRQS